MKALILIGGYGTRLEPLTVATPKSMVPVMNQPFLEWVIRRLTAFGIKQIVLSLGHLPDLILNYFGQGDAFGVDIKYVIENTPLGTGGGIKNAGKYLDETFLVINGDVFTDIDVALMNEYHHRTHALATIALIPVDDPSRYGVIETENTGRVKRFLEKPAREEITTNRINAGFIIMEPEILNFIPENKKYSYEKELFPSLLEMNKAIFGYKTGEYWIDIGTPASYFQLHKDLLSGRSRQYNPPVKYMNHSDSSVEYGDGFCSKDTVVLGKGCVTGPKVCVQDSILWEEVTVGANTTITNSIIADKCRIGDNCLIEGAVFGQKVSIGSNVNISAGSLIYPDSIIC
ncbi:MAG: NDP-sugar synthase [Dehalococcoidaceae bacterium]|nr:NDP-sugar synthase [Dehalococcoidaceae bacterium]